jgi:hypothetical protein
LKVINVPKRLRSQAALYAGPPGFWLLTPVLELLELLGLLVLLTSLRRVHQTYLD